MAASNQIHVLTWGNCVFAVSSTQILTFTDMTRKAAFKTETKENGKKKPKTTNKAPELQTLSFRAELMAELGVNVLSEIDKWIRACESGTQDTLFIGGKKFGSNQWQIKDIEVKDTIYDKEVNKLRRAALQVNMVEYVKVAASASKKKKTSTKKKTTKKVPTSTAVQKPNDKITQRTSATKYTPVAAGGA